MLDHMARAFAAISVCKDGVPRTVNVHETTKTFNGLPNKADLEEVKQVIADLSSIAEVPRTSTRACLYIEDKYGSKGGAVPNLIVVDQTAVEQRRAAEANARSTAERLKREAEENERRAAAEREARAREEALRWRDRLPPMERACVDHIERAGERLEGVEQLDRTAAPRGAFTDFEITFLATNANREQTPRFCLGSLGDNRLVVTKAGAVSSPEYQAARARAEEARRAATEARLAAMEAQSTYEAKMAAATEARLASEKRDRWFKPLSAAAKACVEKIEPQGPGLVGFTTDYQALGRFGLGPEFVIRGTALDSKSAKRSFTCYGVDDGRAATVSKLEAGTGQLGPE